LSATVFDWGIPGQGNVSATSQVKVDGSFLIGDLRRGRFLLQLENQDGKLWRGIYAASASGNLDIGLVPVPGVGSLEINVLDAARVCQDHHFSLQWKCNDLVWPAFEGALGDSGTATVQGLPAGDYVLKLPLTDSQVLSVDVACKPGTTGVRVCFEERMREVRFAFMGFPEKASQMSVTLCGNKEVITVGGIAINEGKAEFVLKGLLEKEVYVVEMQALGYLDGFRLPVAVTSGAVGIKLPSARIHIDVEAEGEASLLLFDEQGQPVTMVGKVQPGDAIDINWVSVGRYSLFLIPDSYWGERDCATLDRADPVQISRQHIAVTEEGEMSRIRFKAR